MTRSVFLRSPILAAAITLVLLPGLSIAQQPAGAPPDPAQQAAAQGTELFNAGKFAEAAAAFEQFIKDNPNSGVIADVKTRLAYAYLMSQQSDKAITVLKEVLALTPDKLPPQVTELAASLLPEAYNAKASAMKADDPARIGAFEAAIKAYEDFLTKYPQSADIETAMFGRATASFQTKNYADAAIKLNEYLQRFPNSDQSQDVQFLLAIALSTDASETLKSGTEDALKKQAVEKLIKAESILQAIIQRRTDLALVNDALFQLGETYYLHAQASPAAEKSALLQKAKEAFGKVQPKEPMIKAQKDRINAIRAQLQQTATTADPQARVKLIQRLNRILEREAQKLTQLEQKAPPTLAAQIRMGEILFQDEKYDEVRVLFNYLKNVATTEQEKKSMAYHIAMSYALQAVKGKGDTGANGLAARAVKAYEDFKTRYINAEEKENPTADNLPVIVGVMFLNEPNKDPDQAVKFLKEAMTLYPKGRFMQLAMLQISEAYRQKGEPQEAIRAIEDVLKSNSDPNLVRPATLSWAVLLKDQAMADPTKPDMAQLDQAVEKLRSLIKDFPASAEAETAWAVLVEVLLTKDPAAAATEARGFADKYPKGAQTPAVLRMGSVALQKTNDVEGSIKLSREIIEKYPESEEAASAYFSIAAVAHRAQKHDEVVAILDEFIAKRPQDSKIDEAYFLTAQAMEQTKTPDQVAQLQKAVDRYAEFQQKYPDHPRAAESLMKVIHVRDRMMKLAGNNFSAITDPAKKELWEAQAKAIVDQAEVLIDTYPDSNEVASALSAILSIQKKQISAEKMKTEDVVKYFETLRDKYGGNTQLRSKISFTLAGYLMPIDPMKAIAIMNAAYDEKLKYSPDDMELYATVLMKGGQVDKAAKVYEKLTTDYADERGPAGKEAAVVAVVGTAKIAFAKGDMPATEAAILKFKELTKGQKRSARHSEIDLILLERAYKEDKGPDVLKIAGQLAGDQFAAPEVKARALFVAAEMFEKAGKIKEAADNYRKIAAFYGSVVDIASEALYRGAGLLEKIAAAEPDKDRKKLIIENARKAYQLILSNYGATKWADKARERLGQLK